MKLDRGQSLPEILRIRASIANASACFIPTFLSRGEEPKGRTGLFTNEHYFKISISKARMSTTAMRSRATGSPGLRNLPAGSS